MQKFYISFGQVHRHERNGKIFDKDCVAEVEAKDKMEAHNIGMKAFNGVFAFVNTEPNLQYYKRGIIKLKMKTRVVIKGNVIEEGKVKYAREDIVVPDDGRTIETVNKFIKIFPEEMEIESFETGEQIICAACISENGTIFRGHRHSDCIAAMQLRAEKFDNKPEAQGFITSNNRYVTREEAFTIQLNAGISSKNTGGWVVEGELYSKDLY